MSYEQKVPLDTKEPSLSRVGELDHGDAFDSVSTEDDRRIRRKIDLNLLPLICVVVALQFLDKTCMSYAAVMGFREDTGLSLSDYSWLGSVFYFGYLVGEYPLTLSLQKLPISKVTSTCIVLWGIMLGLMSVGGSFKVLMVLRFFLGVFESSMIPALGLFMTQYYKAREQGTRTGIWFSFNALGCIVGALLAFGLYSGDKSGSLAVDGWRLVYIILGILTVFVGILFFIFVPDTPAKARFLSPADRKLAVERIRSNQQGVINRSFRVEQVKEAFTDKFTWVYAAVCLLACIPNGGITNFFAILIKGFGFSTEQTLLLGMVQAFNAFSYFTFLWLGDRYHLRCLMSTIPSTISTFGVLLVWLLPDSMPVGRLIGFILSLPYIVVYATVVSLITSNVVGYTKKTTVNGIFFVAYCAGNLIGPQTFRAQYAPRYAPALATVVGCNTLIACLMTLLHFMYKRENAKRDLAIAEDRVVDTTGREFDDLTDRQNPAFRYAL